MNFVKGIMFGLVCGLQKEKSAAETYSYSKVLKI